MIRGIQRKTEAGQNYKDKDTVSKLVEEDGGNVTIYAQWKKKKKLCLKVSSNVISEIFRLIPLAASILQKAGSVIIRIIQW